jgi:hypothetical protein
MILFDEVDIVRTQSLPMAELWRFLPIGYVLTILIETPFLLIGLPRPVGWKQRLWCGAWLTACTYPIVILVLPAIFLDGSRLLYLAVAETFAPAAECVLFWLVTRRRLKLTPPQWIQAFVAITVANLASFLAGEIMNMSGWFGWF